MSNCINWDGGVDKTTGYGVTWRDGKKRSAHREAWRTVHGEIPAGMVVRHSCDNKICVNAKHLLLGTYADNIADKVARNRQAKGEAIATAKLDADIVSEIVYAMQAGRMRKGERGLRCGYRQHIANKFGVSVSLVKQIASGAIWKHVNG